MQSMKAGGAGTSGSCRSLRRSLNRILEELWKFVWRDLNPNPSVFVQGCPHNCPGCHNPQTHDFSGGHIAQTDDVIAHLGQNPLVRGLTLSGGEPMMQPEPLYLIAKAAKEKGMNVWCYTGFTLENLLKENRADRMKLLSVLDVLVDGPFLSHERSLDLLYCGSKNQRLIDVAASLVRGKPVLWQEEDPLAKFTVPES